jgi:hypothetical protein
MEQFGELGAREWAILEMRFYISKMGFGIKLKDKL